MELCEGIGHSMYGRLFGYFISDAAPFRLPGAPFLAAGSFLATALAVIARTFATLPSEAARFL